MSANTATAAAAASAPKQSYKSSSGAPIVSLPSQYNSPPSSASPPHLSHAPTAVTTAGPHPGGLLPIGQPISSMLAMSGGLLPIDHFRLKLYNYAMSERLRCGGYPSPGPGHPMPLCPQPLSVENPAQRVAAAAMMGQYGPGLALQMSLFQNRMFSGAEEPKPQHSYIGLIAIAILNSPESKLVLSDIYQHILDNYPYFRNRGPGWRNSIRHNLSLNDCFVKAGRSANGKGHYWAIHPANVEDFKKGDFRRRKAQRKVRKHMGLAVDDAGTDSPSPPPITDPFTNPWSMPHVPGMELNGALYHPQAVNPHSAFQMAQNTGMHQQPSSLPFPTDHFHHNLLQRHHQQLQIISSKLSSRKRQFDVASLLAPDDNNPESGIKRTCTSLSPCEDSNEDVIQTTILPSSSDNDENIDVEANDAAENGEETDEEVHREQSPEYFPTAADSNADHPLKRRRVLMSSEEVEERQSHQNPKFPWQGVIPMQKNLPAGFDKSLLERYYGHPHHQQQHSHHLQVEDAHSTTSHGEEISAKK